MIGPVMIGPSSSHTAGVVRIGRMGRKVLGSQPTKAHITFYNSFARTYEGHGSDKAILAGLLGMQTDDKRIKTSKEICEEQGLEYEFKPVGNASAHHPNTIKLVLTNSQGNTVEVLGISRGGGIIAIKEINGFECNFSATNDTLIVQAKDKKGAISFIANIIANDDCNIGAMTVSREGKNKMACQFIEMDSPIKEMSINYLNSLDWVNEVIYLSAVDKD
ncbi:L-serine dehydratase [Sediminitomix flava]|uniref:L-serine dehydratase n=2 Tax=Sediminitomix flava TaxID=379075 RepID=A0A315Z880_SEDFL|nr:L-serine dehydratase [Sediminitomix flava]